MQPTQQRNDVIEESITRLQECLRAELSAVETYEEALKSVTHVGLHQKLQEILVSHARRTEILDARIRGLGATPAKSSGVWGAFARFIQMGADLLGNRIALGALEAGEDRGLELYTVGLDGCDSSTKELIRRELMPEQNHTHALCRTLRDFASVSS